MSGVKTIEPDIWAVWSDYFNDWRYPAAIKFDPRKADLFTLSRVKAYNKARHIKCAAAESPDVYTKSTSENPKLILYIQNQRLKYKS